VHKLIQITFTTVSEQNRGDHKGSVCWTMETVLLFGRSRRTRKLYFWEGFTL